MLTIVINFVYLQENKYFTKLKHNTSINALLSCRALINSTKLTTNVCINVFDIARKGVISKDEADIYGIV